MRLPLENKGFTLIETILVVALVGILFGASYTVYDQLYQRIGLERALVNTQEALRRAALLSLLMDGDSSWGVRIESGYFTFFKGESFASRDASYDEVVEFEHAEGSDEEYVFGKLTGRPEVPGEIEIVSTAGGQSATIQVNEAGNITIE